MQDADFREAYRAHKDVVYRFARRMTGSQASAEDIAQEAFLALWRDRAAFHPERGSLRSFLLGVTRNLALQRLRGMRPQEELEDDCSVTAPFDIEGIQRAEIVARAVAALPPLQRGPCSFLEGPYRRDACAPGQRPCWRVTSTIGGGRAFGVRAFIPGARNFAAYPALRRTDLRPLQTSLMPLGLSSLDRCEGRVRPNIEAVIEALATRCGEPVNRPATTARAFFRGERLCRCVSP